VVATGIQSRGDRDRHVAFADVWIATRGLRFAAEAAVEFMALARRDRGPSFAVRVGPPPPVQHMLPSESRNPWEAPDPRLQVALRVRAALAAAPDDVYAETVSALAGYRDAGAFARVATSVLAPTQTAWVEQDLAEAIADKDEYRVTALLTAVATPEQATAISTAYASTAFAAVKSLPLLTTFVDGVGPAAVPALLHWLDSSTDSDAESRRRVLSVVAALPGDQAMRGLVDRADQKYVQPALLAAAGRFPARALCLLADSATRPTLAELLTAHVLAHPDVVARVLPELTPETARRIEAITGARGDRPGGASLCPAAAAGRSALAAPPQDGQTPCGPGAAGRRGEIPRRPSGRGGRRPARHRPAGAAAGPDPGPAGLGGACLAATAAVA
jgi:hypothetical protein